MHAREELFLTLVMAKFYNEISAHHKEFIEKQHMFFVASAPLSAEGHVNLSPKGMDCFKVFSANRVAYMDIIGSGNETSAHILENGRITFMFCAYDGPPLILRLYGKGCTVIPGDAEWEARVEAHRRRRPTQWRTTETLDLVDVFGQICVLDAKGDVAAMFFVFRNRVAAWLPDGTRHGDASIIGGPSTEGALEAIGHALRKARQP